MHHFQPIHLIKTKTRQRASTAEDVEEADTYTLRAGMENSEVTLKRSLLVPQNTQYPSQVHS